MNYEKILDILDALKKEAKANQKATDKYFDIVYPDTYPPVIEDHKIIGFLSAIAVINEDIADWLEYYIYETPIIKGKATVTLKDDTEYDFKNRDEVIDFLNKNFNETA